MTRLHFILLSFFSSAASVFAMKPDREQMAMEWIKENGFTCQVSGFTGLYRMIWRHRSIPDKAVSCYTDRMNCVLFMRLLDQRGFVIEQKHCHYDIVSSVQRDGRHVDFAFNEVEDAPPTLHRFTRPEWL